MSNPIILYKNVLKNGALTATDTETGYDVNNIIDLRTHTKWKGASAGTKYITEAPLAKDSVTLANMRLSLADGYAFVDFSTADVLTDYIGKRLVIIDSAGKKAIGYIKAAGTGETYDEKVSNGSFSADTTGWSAFDGRSTIASIAGGYSGNCLEITKVLDATQYVYQNFTGVPGALFLFSRYLKSGTSGNEQSYAGIYTTNVGALLKNIIANSTESWVESSLKWLADRTGLSIGLAKTSSTAGTMLFDEVTLKQVITPSATGVTIVSTPGGSTYNWELIETGFNYNDAAGYAYKISEADSVDALGIEGHNLGTAGAAVSVESSDDESTWTERLAAFNPSDDTAILKTMTAFRAASKRLKIVTAATAPYIACALLGERLEFNRGAYIGDGAIVPWQFGIVAAAQRSKTGNLLGNTIRYKPIDISMTIPTDTYDWFNTYFWPFWRDHGSELKPFFFAPDLTTFTDKIFWLQLTEDSVLAPPMLMKDRVDQYTFIMRGVLEE